VNGRTDQPGAETVASHYAQALLDLAGEQDQLETVAEELEGLAELAGREQPFREFLASAVIPPRQKHQALQRALAGRASPLTLRFLGVLLVHGRGRLLAAVAASYGRLKNLRQGKVAVAVTTAVALDEDQRQQLRQVLRDLFQREPLLEVSVEPALLGGLSLTVGDEVFDASLRAGLEQMRRRMLAGPRQRPGEMVGT
jgi:F-type H+-transporting ATPase subunit delta